MARRSQCSSAGDNPLDPNYLLPHYREEYRLAIDSLVEHDLEGYYEFLKSANVVDFLSGPEIEHIQSTVQCPRHVDKPGAVCQGNEEAEGSSDTYWPTHSDLDAPSLDLGWPEQLHFVGPTEIITFVNPPDPAMPSIKTQARRLIKDAQLVIAVAMDIFTDVDIFADLLEATKRNVAVYILLDQQNAHYFTTMVANCRVNLDQIKCMRVRTVAGQNYYCRTGKSFKGQMMNRFLLIDSRAVLGGNYSFMWSFEKLHRCLAHLFLGQLVVTFDEEFRILYAQSEPLVVESAVVPIQKYSSMPELQKTHKVYPRKQGMYNAEMAGHPYEGCMDMDPKMFPLRRGESAQMLLQPQANMHPSQQYRMDRPGAFDSNMFRRSSYGEGTPGGYYQQYLMHKNKQNMDAMETQSTHSHRDQYHYERTGREPVYDPSDKFRPQGYQHSDQYSEPGGQPSMDQVDSYDHVLKFLQSNPTGEAEQGFENFVVPEGPYSMSGQRRQCLGQPYACQTSPTQLSPHEQKGFVIEPAPERKPRDAAAKKGMRDWRIHSYLSAYDDTASEDTLPPQWSDIGDNSPFSSQERLCDLDPLAPRVGNRELPKMPSAVLSSRCKKSFQQESMKNRLESSCTTESEKVDDGEDKLLAEMDGTKDEPFRRRPNPTLQRTSRLRNSLLFSSNVDQHRSLLEKAKSTEQKEESAKVVEKGLEKNPLKKQSTIAMGEEPKPVELPSSDLQRTSSFIMDMNDPDTRLQFFKQLAAQRKAKQKPSDQESDKILSIASEGGPSVAEQKQNVEVSHMTDKPAKMESQSSKETKDKVPIITVHVSDSDTKLVESLSPTEDVPPGQTHGTLPQMATDAEKIEQKRLQEPAAAKCVPSHQPSSSSSAQQSESPNAMKIPPDSNLKKKSLDSSNESGKRELSVMPLAIISGKPVLPVISGESASGKTTSVETTDSLRTTASEKAAEVASVGKIESGETKEGLVQKRPKPSLQRASKLRNSLLFNSPLEQHRSQWENDPSGQIKTDDRLSDLSQDSQGKSDRTSETLFKRQASFTMGDKPNPVEFQSKVLQRTTAMLDLSNPDSRLQFFRELAAKRKGGRMAAMSAESATGHNSQKSDETEDTSATKGNVSVPEQTTTDPLSKPLLAETVAPQVLDDDTKTLKPQSAPDSHEIKNLTDNSGQCNPSGSEFAQTATDSEKMERMKLHVKAAAKLPCTPSTSSADSSSALEDIPKDVTMYCEDQASKKQISDSDVSTKQVPVDSSSVSFPINAGKTTHSSTSHPVKSISKVEDTQEEICLNPNNKTVDSDTSSVCSIEMGSGTECFATAPSSPCTPTPTEIFPVNQKESKLTVVSPTAENILPPSPSSSIKTSSPQRVSYTDTRSELEKCSLASHELKTKQKTKLSTSPAKSRSVTEHDSTEHHLSPVSSPTQSPKGDSHLHTPVKESYAPDKTEDRPPSQTPLTTPDISTVDPLTKTDCSLASVSSPTKPCSTAVVSPAESKSPQAGDSIPGITQASPTLSTCGSSKTKQKQNKSKLKKQNSQSQISPPLKSTPPKMVPASEPKSHSDIKITEKSSALVSVKTEEGLSVIDASASPATSTVDSCTTTDSSLCPVSTTTHTNPMTNVVPTQNRSSPETKISETSPALSEGTSSSHDSPTKTIPVVGSPIPSITHTEDCSSPKVISISSKEAVLLTESSSQLPSVDSPSLKSVPMSPTVSTVDSPTKSHSNSHLVSSPLNSPMAEVPSTNLTSPSDVKTLESSPLSDPGQTDSNFSLMATTDPLAKPTATVSDLTASPGLETPKSTDPPHAEENTSYPVVSILGDSSNSELTIVEPALPTEESSNTTSSTYDAVTERLLKIEEKVVVGDHPSADAVNLSEVSPTDELGTTISQDTKDAVASLSAEDSKEQKSPSAEPTKGHPSRYQSSTANVLSCSNLRDDTKVLLEQISANSQSRAAKQNLPATDDAKEDEVKAPKDKSNQNVTSKLQSWNTHLSEKERDRLITAMESKRKERRVYSRFEAL
ncbi:protein FAM83H-like isoform X1 [Alosa sapidissima]|uniref:protein FAM83H-like isoform X1 n=1 Tax=Alosa sapidissima TaxID=34773 RepID=UPI001C09352D|nr:protein FAM83H-like isoform X1 [Alosa sapidissima]